MINLDDRIFEDGTVSKIKGNAFCVLLAIASHMNKKNTCYPSIKRLERLTGLKKATIIKCTKELCKAGLLEKKQDKKGGKYTSNIYKVSSEYIKIHASKPKNKQPSPSIKKHNSVEGSTEYHFCRLDKNEPKVLSNTIGSIKKDNINIRPVGKNEKIKLGFHDLKNDIRGTLKKYLAGYYTQSILTEYCTKKNIEVKKLQGHEIEEYLKWVDIEKVKQRILNEKESYFSNGKSYIILNSFSKYIVTAGSFDLQFDTKLEKVVEMFQRYTHRIVNGIQRKSMRYPLDQVFKCGVTLEEIESQFKKLPYQFNNNWMSPEYALKNFKTLQQIKLEAA